MRAVFVLALLCFVGCLSLHTEAAGQMFVDKIEPVKDTRVNFLSNLASPDAILGEATTDTLVVLKQFELQIPVEDVVLTGDGGISFTGSLGAAFTTSNGDVNFDAEDGSVIMSGTNFDFDSTNDLDLTSLNGDVELTSALNTEFVAGGLDFNIGSGGIDMSAAGDVQLRSRNAVNLKAGNTLALQNEEEVDLVIGGDSSITSGDQFIMSAGAGITGDATFDAHFRSIEDLSIVSGGDGVFFSGQQANLISVGEFFVEGSTFTADAQEELRLIGGAVCADVRQVAIDAIGVGSNVEAHGDSVNLCADDEVSLTASGISSDVVIDTTDSFSSSSSTITVDSGLDILIGGVTTNSLSVSANSGFSVDADDVNVHADEDLSMSADNSLTMTSSDDTLHLAVDHSVDADTRLSLNADLISVNSALGNSLRDIDFDSSSDMTWNADDIDLDTFQFELSAPLITVVADDFAVTSENRNTVVFAGGSLSFASDLVDIETSQFEMTAVGALTVSVDESVILIASEVDMYSEHDFVVTAASDLDLGSTGSMLLASNNMAISSDDAFDITLTGSAKLDVDDLSFTSNQQLSADASGSHFWTLSDLMTVTANEITIAAGEELYVKTSDLNIDGGSVTLSVDSLETQFDSIDVNGGDISFNADDNLSFSSANDLLIDMVGAVAIDVGGDIRGSAADTNTLSAGGTILLNADDNLELSGSGPFTFTSAGGLVVNGEGLEFSTPATVSWLGSDTLSMTSTLGGITFDAGDFNTHAGDNLAFTSEGDIDFNKGGQATSIDTISIFGMTLDFSGSGVVFTSTGTSHFNAGSIDFNGNGDFTVTGDEDILINGESVTVGSAQGPIVINSDVVVIESGAEEPFTTTAARDIAFTDTAAGGISIDSETNAFYTAGDEVTFSAGGDIVFGGEFDVHVTAATDINVAATTSGLINSYEDLFFVSGEDQDITVTSTAGSDLTTFGRNALLVAHGQEGLTNCGITVTAEDTHTYSTFGNSYGGGAGDLEVLAEDSIEIHSIDTQLTTDPFGSALPTGSGVGNIATTSDGHVFLHSEESGQVYITEGPGLDVTTTAAEGNVEIIAHDAYLKMLAEESILNSGDDIEVLADQGFTEFAEDSISFTSDDLLVHSARGIDFASDVMVVNGDTTTVEVQDSFTMQQYGSANGGILFNASDDFTTLVFDGRLTVFNSSNDFTVDSARDVRFTADDGRVIFDADFGDLTFTSEDALTVVSDEGTASFRTRGEGGSMAMEGSDWVFTSSESFIRMFSQDSTTITAGDDFNVNADTSYAPGPGHCLSIQTERPNDSVTITGTGGVSLAATSNGNTLGRDRFVVAGNNIDAEDNDIVQFTLSDLFEVGTTQTPGGEPSYQPIIRVISNSATFTSTGGDIDIATDNTFNSESATTTTVSASTAAFDSNGSMIIAAQAPSGASADVTIIAATDVDARAPVLTQTGPASVTAVATGSLFIESSGDDIGDRLEVLAGQDLSIEALTYTAQANVHNSVADTVLFQTVAGNIAITNVPDSTASEVGTITFHATEELDFDATNDITFAQSQADGRVSFVASDAIEFAGGAPLTVTATSLFEADIEFSASEDVVIAAATSFSVSAVPGITVFSPATTNEQEEERSGDIVFESTDDFTVTAETSLTLNTAANTTFSSATADVDFTAATTIGIDFTEVVPNYESALTVASQQGSVDWLATQLVFQGDPAATGLWQFTADSTLEFDAATTFSIPNARDLFFDGEAVLIDHPAATSITLTSNDDVEFFTIGPGSDILVSDPAPASITTAEATFRAVGGAAYLDVEGTASLTGTTFDTFVLQGDILFKGVNIDKTADAFRYAAQGVSDNGHAIALSATDGIDFDAFGVLQFDGREYHYFKSQGATDLEAEGTIDIITYNANSNVEFTALGNIVVTPAVSLLMSGPDLDVSAQSVILTAPDIDVTTVLPFTDILFTTNPQADNFAGSISDLAATSRTVTVSEDIVVRSGDGGSQGTVSISAVDLTAVSVRTTPVGSPSDAAGVQIVAEEGEVLIDSASASFTASGGLLEFNAGDDIFVSATNTLGVSGDYVSFESEHGRILLLNPSVATMTAAAETSLLFRTIGYGHERDIVFSSVDTLSIVCEDLDVQAHGGEGSIYFNADDSVSVNSNTVSFSATNVNTVTDAGIRFLTTNRLGLPDGQDGFVASARDDITIRTLNFLDDIFFESDFRVILEASSPTGFISHTRYNYRLGFFSVNPAHIHLVNMQAADQCLEVGWCGFTSPPNRGNANLAIGNVSSASRRLQDILRQYGLINWKNPIT